MNNKHYVARKIDGIWCVGCSDNLQTKHDATAMITGGWLSDHAAKSIAEFTAEAYNSKDGFVESQKPTLYMLVGVPASGKSTWVASQEWIDDPVFISSDAYIERYAAGVDKTYSEVFESYVGTATSYMNEDLNSARLNRKNIVWDQTNVSRKIRFRKLKQFKDYDAVAVVFKTPDRDTLNARLAARPGKNIPEFVMNNMINTFEMPTEDEGFKQIILVETNG
jgi:predicted kinase